MRVIVPLAGPDFERRDGSTKAEHLLDGEPLLRKALTSRSWWQRGEVAAGDFIFVLRDTVISRRFAERCLSVWFPGAETVYISAVTRGAAFTALAGVALCKPDELLCVDLADILYSENFSPQSAFDNDLALGGILPTFQSHSSVYSYVELADDGRALRTAEKKVISSNASAGTYFFRNASFYLHALDHSIKNEDELSYNGIFFVCPLFNGVIGKGGDVRVFEVGDLIDLKQAAD